MKQKQKVSLVIFMGLVLTLLASSENAQAKEDWKTYFSNEEAKSIRKMIEKKIMSELEDPSKEWKGIINRKVVGDGVAKKKVFTGTYVGAAQASASEVWDDEGTPVTNYFQKIEAPVDIDEVPLVTIWERYPEHDSVFGATAWTQEEGDNLWITDGAIWIYVGNTAGYSAEGQEYKISLSY